MPDVDVRIERIAQFKENLIEWRKSRDGKLREWLNQNVHGVRREVVEAGCFKRVTIHPPPAVGGLVMSNMDPFDLMFERPYRMSMLPTICDMLDSTLGALRRPISEQRVQTAAIQAEVQRDYAFVAMPMDKDNHALVDVLEAIKAVARECGIMAERIDDERSERITDRVLESIRKAEFVIVDLTNERPNVLLRPGMHMVLAIPIYIASDGTKVHFDVKDYPVIMFRNMKELREGLVRRLRAIAEKAMR
jgi:hypothetical protein